MNRSRPSARALAGGAALLALLAAACGGDLPGARGAGSPAADAARGGTLFLRSCAPCHGRSAQGIRGLGADLRGNAFVAARSDAEVVSFLKVGRRAGDPGNRTRVDMPPRGGNPGLTDADLAAIAAFLRTLELP